MPIPSSFRTDPGVDFVSTAFGNINMKDKFSTLGTKTTDYTTLVVFRMLMLH